MALSEPATPLPPIGEIPSTFQWTPVWPEGDRPGSPYCIRSLDGSITRRGQSLAEALSAAKMICDEDARTVARGGHGFRLTYRAVDGHGWQLAAERDANVRNPRVSFPPVLGIMTVIRPNKEGNDDELLQDKVRAYDDSRGTAARRRRALLLCAGSASKHFLKCVGRVLCTRTRTLDPLMPRTVLRRLFY